MADTEGTRTAIAAAAAAGNIWATGCRADGREALQTTPPDVAVSPVTPVTAAAAVVVGPPPPVSPVAARSSAGAGAGAGAGSRPRGMTSLGKPLLAHTLAMLDGEEARLAGLACHKLHAAAAVLPLASIRPGTAFAEDIVTKCDNESGLDDGDILPVEEGYEGWYKGASFGRRVIYHSDHEGTVEVRIPAVGAECVVATPGEVPVSEVAVGGTVTLRGLNPVGYDFRTRSRPDPVPVDTAFAVVGREEDGSTLLRGRIVIGDYLRWHFENDEEKPIRQKFVGWLDRYQVEQRVTDGVSWRDGRVPAALIKSLAAHIDAVKAAEPADYHPHSNGIVRDIVHPALYSYVKGVSPFMPTEAVPTPDMAAAKGEKDRWGRPYEGSKYQWLPSPYMVDRDGVCKIDGYVNNLDRDKYGGLYADLERLFGLVLPHLEQVVSYGKAYGTEFLSSTDEDYFTDFDDADMEICDMPHYSLRDRELQVITKIVDYELKPGQTYDGVWHVEGMSHEHIVATALYILERDDCVQGGSLLFRRPWLKEEARFVFSNVPQDRPEDVNEAVETGLIPLGHLATPQGRIICFPNSHIHKVSTLAAVGKPGKRRIVVFFLVDPDVRIMSTREVAPQQSMLSREEAEAHRLELMKERKYAKQSYNVREVELCEH